MSPPVRNYEKQRDLEDQKDELVVLGEKSRGGLPGAILNDLS